MDETLALCAVDLGGRPYFVYDASFAGQSCGGMDVQKMCIRDRACGSRLFVRPRVVICVPSGVTEVERRAVRQAAAKAGARQVTVIEEPVSYTHLGSCS